MLEGAYTSPKMRRLAAILDIPWPYAVGLAGLLWRFAAKHAPTGAVGRHEDEDIATALEWPGDAQTLREAFVRCRLVDEVNSPDRLLIHDWPDHCPRHVRATLQRTNRAFSHHYANTTDATTVRTTEATAGGTVVVTTSSSSSASSSTSSSPSTIPSSCALSLWSGEIWKCWVKGRKMGKMLGVAAIETSIEKHARMRKATVETVGKDILERTRKAARIYTEQIAKGEIEPKYVPTGLTFFSQERWNDDIEQAHERSELRRERAKRELEEARADSNMG